MLTSDCQHMAAPAQSPSEAEKLVMERGHRQQAKAVGASGSLQNLQEDICHDDPCREFFPHPRPLSDAFVRASLWGLP